MRIPAAGGTPTSVTRLRSGEQSHRWPEFLPDGRRFLFPSTQGAKGTQGVFVASLDGGDPVRLLDDDVPALYVEPGRLLVVRNGGLVALAFNPTNATLAGDARVVADAVGWDATMIRGAVSSSATGVLAYRSGLAVPRRLVWVDRTGAERGMVGSIDNNAPGSPEISPDGRRAALFRTVAGNLDVWLTDLGRAVSTRFTFDEHVDYFPVWSADGDRIFFASNRSGVFELYEKAIGGGDERPMSIGPPGPKLPMSASSDRRFILVASQVPETGVDLWAVPLGTDQKPFPVVRTRFDEMAGQFAPDGRSIAYESNASGRVEIYVRPFPEAGAAMQVSSNGGTQARWRADGKELFYLAPDSRLLAVSIARAADTTFQIGTPTPLFTVRTASGMNVYPAVGTKPQYAVASDGRFLMNLPVDGGTVPPITVVTDWPNAAK